MAAYLDKKKFAALCMNAESVDVVAEKQKCEDRKSQFEHVMFDAKNMNDLADVPTEELLQMAKLTPYWMGGLSPWEKLLQKHLSAMLKAHAIRRMRVL